MGGSISRILSLPKEEEAAIDLDPVLQRNTSFLPEEHRRGGVADNQTLLLEIAPVGVFPHDQLPDQGVSSYLTISPLPAFARFPPLPGLELRRSRPTKNPNWACRGVAP